MCPSPHGSMGRIRRNKMKTIKHIIVEVEEEILYEECERSLNRTFRIRERFASDACKAAEILEEEFLKAKKAIGDALLEAEIDGDVDSGDIFIDLEPDPLKCEHFWHLFIKNEVLE